MEFHSKIHKHKLTKKEKGSFCCHNDKTNINVDTISYNCRKCNFYICQNCFETNRKKIRYEFIYSGKRRNFKKSLIKLNISKPTSLCYQYQNKKTIFSFDTDTYLTINIKKILKKKLNLSIMKKKKVFSTKTISKSTSINSSFPYKTRPKSSRTRLPEGFYNENEEIHIII